MASCAFFKRAVLAVSALTASIAYAVPPLDCVENSKGQRWCASSGTHFDPNPVRDELSTQPWVHPATIKAPFVMFQPVYAVVRPIPARDLLPQYSVPRLSQIGIYDGPAKPVANNPESKN